ncbi:hypothetical protein VP01_2276g4 [Puccinia sorghi]|uniref:Uncharacterized protein n=1 Tax=Puccinia sorghi TaxID=27349 RepID=A0A0L6V886_9BASI|nr:hypothetical protein VP01_2276g4 [Puccinia sorghi]
MVLEEMDCISGLLHWWVQGQGKELRKIVGLTATEAKNLRRLGLLKVQSLEQYKKNNQLKLLFSRKDIVSDWEDGPGDKGPTQILPIWQSEEFHQIV